MKNVDEWTYECECLECDWRAVWEPDKPWQHSAAARHADAAGHRVKTTTVRVIRPKETALAAKREKPKEPRVGWCPQCQRYIGAGAGRMFKLAVRSHERSSGHVVEVRLNPEFRS